MDRENLLGEFLRARREVTTPAQVGLLYSSPRQTPGLRQEEVAMLAGVSTDYYIRLEQGTEHHPSQRVLGALGRVLDLSPEAETRLCELAQPEPRRRGTSDQAEQVSPDLLRLMRSWPGTPALVFGRWMDVLATNPLATVLYEGLEHADNLVRLVFLDPAAHEFYQSWEQVARCRVAYLHAAARADPDDPYLIELVGELSFKSEDFRQLWECRDIIGKFHEDRYFHHREVGDLILNWELFTVNSAPGQQLLIFQAEPASPSAQALALLGSLAVMTG